MNHKIYYKYNLLLFCICLILLNIRFQRSALCAETSQEPVKYSIGVGALSGLYDVHNTGSGDIEWKPDFGFGGGFIFESMFTGTFGIHSGLWYSHFKLHAEFRDNNSTVMTKHSITSDMISMPVYLISSLSSGTVGFNILTGLNCAYIISSRMDPGDNGTENQNIHKVLNTGQIGAGAGFEFLFKITRFTRLFITITGEYYFKNLISDSNSSIDHFYNATVRTGFMLCTF
jgi:hypothetical protein